MSWRYENCGEADSITGGYTAYAGNDRAKSYFGVAFVQSNRNAPFKIPKDSKEIWIHCRVYHKFGSTSRFRIYNDPSHGANGSAIGICLEENTSQYLRAFCNGSDLGRLSREFADTWYNCWLHMKSDAINGSLEFYMDGSQAYSYTGNVNHGAPFADIYLQTDSDDNLFSNLTISDEPIPLGYSVPILKLSFYYYRKYLGEGYDFPAIDKSFFRYCESVVNAVNMIIGHIKEYEEKEADVIKKVLSFTSAFEKNKIGYKTLIDEDKAILETRQRYFEEWLDIDTGKCKAQLLSIKDEIEARKSRLHEINQGKNIIAKLAEIEAEPRASFEFLLENMGHIAWDVCSKINFFALHDALLTNIGNLCISWNEDYLNFKTTMKDTFVSVCRDDGIDEEIFQVWYAEWQKKRRVIENLFLPIVEFALKDCRIPDNDTPTLAEQVLKILQTHKEETDNFYLNDRKNIYQKFAFQTGGDLQEKFETESELYKLTEKLQHSLKDIIFLRESTEERVFLLQWAEPILNLPISEIISFVHDRDLAIISGEIMSRFTELKRQNFVSYLADSQAYGAALKKREAEYNALMFHMRKELK